MNFKNDYRGRDVGDSSARGVRDREVDGGGWRRGAPSGPAPTRDKSPPPKTDAWRPSGESKNNVAEFVLVQRDIHTKKLV